MGGEAFHLQPGIHLEEVEVLVVVGDKLDRACPTLNRIGAKKWIANIDQHPARTGPEYGGTSHDACAE